MTDPTRPPLRLGTRRSPLALHQAALVRDAIALVDPGLDVELVEITSDGDVDQRELREIHDRGIFAHALERRLLDGTIDAAVHSSKDLALDDTEGLVLAAWLPREDPRDALVNAGCELRDLPEGATIATGSARRMAGLRTVRADLVPSPIRGNVATRIQRARERGDAGLVLAMAGLRRLGLVDEGEHDIRAIAVDELVPEAGQGAVVVQTTTQVCPRTGLDWTAIDHVATRRSVQLERAIAKRFGGGCDRPVGVHAALEDGRIHVFFAPSPDEAGQRAAHDVLGLELGTLVSVSAPRDVDDAAAWTAQQLAPTLAQLVGATLVEVTTR
ncbi:MAG: Porphobilinogen deaminase [Thermoleophilia bacterium]|nr:Porphobilinogen deaminase [Thermoleophilia bacterium]